MKASKIKEIADTVNAEGISTQDPILEKIIVKDIEAAARLGRYSRSFTLDSETIKTVTELIDTLRADGFTVQVVKNTLSVSWGEADSNRESSHKTMNIRDRLLSIVGF